MNQAQRNLDIPIDYPVCRNIQEYHTLIESLTKIGYERRGTFKKARELSFLVTQIGVEIKALPHLDTKHQTLSQIEFDFLVKNYNE